MTTVALVGGDGAGKTTIAKLLETSLPGRVKYLYMGSSVISSNAALPTSRLARTLKMRAHRKASIAAGDEPAREPSSNDLHYGTAKRNVIWIFARFLNRMAEAWWRQLLCLSYQVRGYIVICDRHVLFQTRDLTASGTNFLFDRLEHWILYLTYPRPSAVILLDAPPEVLFSRKGESTLQELNEQRETILEQGKRMRNFFIINANQPLEQVFAEAEGQIFAFYESVNNKKQHQRSKAG